jgi:hypothetical protein
MHVGRPLKRQGSTPSGEFLTFLCEETVREHRLGVNRNITRAYSIEHRATFPVGSALSRFTIQRRIAAVGNGNIGVGNTATPRKSSQQMAGAMSQQSAPVMGDNQGSPQKFVRLVGCRDSKAKSASEVRPYPNPLKR